MREARDESGATLPPAPPAAVKIGARPDMRASVCEGLFGQVFLNLAGAWSTFITAFALSLGVGPRAFGFLFAAGPLMLFSQILGPALLPLCGGSRKRLVVAASAAARGLIFLLPLVAVWLAPEAALAVLIFCFLGSQVFTGIMTNVWTGWIGATVPDRVRGRFLGKRTQLLTGIGLVAAFAASLLKDLASPGEETGLTGFFRRLFGVAGGLWGAGGERYAFFFIFFTGGRRGSRLDAAPPAPARPPRAPRTGFPEIPRRAPSRRGF